MSDLDAESHTLDGVAIIGMAGRFPGARSVSEFWQNQLDGIESISQFDVSELEARDQKAGTGASGYVRARSVIDDVDLFDAEFFGIYPREAELMDPQQRLFLECCWEAIEDAGYVPDTYPGLIGVFAGSSLSSYFLSRLCTTPGFIERFTSGYQISNYTEMMGNSLDFLSTRVSYKLNLRGPSFTMLSACSTSLLSVTQACQSLLTYQSDMALAGGVSITLPQRRGYPYQDGGMASPDGHCRAFDADAQGTVFGSGVGVVLLKRLDDAIRDGDQIYSVIRGFAANNDGSAKVGYTAPSVDGQASVIAMAHEAAGIDPATIGYIEAHGTGTPLGDPIELAGLTKAFRASTSREQFCTIGTAKTNVGHLDIAAGVTGLINASHIVRHGVFPPTLHFKRPNPKLNLESSPFRIVTQRSEWKSDGGPRRAGVSAFGVGGTNAHIVLEQPPERQRQPSTKPNNLLVLSAKSPTALERATDNLVEHLRSHPELDLSDVAWTLQTGRRAFAYRRAVVAGSTSEAILALSTRDRKRLQTRSAPGDSPTIYFMFPGQGSQHANMAREIYEVEPAFRQTVDQCAELLQEHLGLDLRDLLYPPADASEAAKRSVTDTIIAQPAIFTVEYALAQLWMSWGIQPTAMIGHSVGEFVAACLAGVISLEDALRLVALRGRLMQALPAGGMLSVRLPESEISKLIPPSLSLAAVNSPSLCVVAGPNEALEQFERQLGNGIARRRLKTSHAFHSAMMDPLVDPLTDAFAKTKLLPPNIPYVSGVTGTWITTAEATDPRYWARHARDSVQFSKAVQELRKAPGAVLLEVGPGNALAMLARQHSDRSADQTVVSSLSDGFSGEGDRDALLTALGALWVGGVQPDWTALHNGLHPLRVSLPTYPFERQRHWFERIPATNDGPASKPDGSANGIDSDLQSTPKMEAVNMAPNVTSQLQTSPAVARAARLRTALIEMFLNLSGIDVASAEDGTTFLELGFDSLFLTQVAQAVQEQFDVKITFRQLLNEVSSLAALTQYVDSNLAPHLYAEPAALELSIKDTLPVSTAGAPATILAASSALAAPTVSALIADTALERVMRDQLQAMNQLFARQLETLQAGVAKSSSPIASSATDAAPAVARQSVDIRPVPELPPAEASKPHGPYKPPQVGTSQELTEQQTTHLNLLIDRVTQRTAKSKSFTQRYRDVLADPRVVSGFRPQWKEMVYSIVTDRSKGSRLWDIDGNEYVDLVNGFGPIMLGHRPDFVERAIEEQLHAGFETGPQSPLAGEVAHLFCEMTGNDRMAFCNTGSEAVLAAIRVARTVTGRTKVVMFGGDYHGLFDEVLAKGFKDRTGDPQSAPIAPGIPRQSVSNMIVLDYGADASLEWIRQNAGDLAAVLVEPVQSRHPALQPIDFLKSLREITAAAGTALIFDEVVTGFRVHPGGCQALFGIRADLATYGKVIAGGMPVGILAGGRRFMDALDGGAWQFGDDSYPEKGVTFFAGTFVRHPLALAAMRAVLLHFKEEGPALQERLTTQTAALVHRLNDVLQEQNVPTRLETFGSFFYFSFPPSERLASLFYFYIRDKGVHIREGFPCFLTTSHSEADLDIIVRAFRDSAIEMRRGGFFSEPAGALPPLQLVERTAEPDSRVPDPIPLTEAQREIFLAAVLGSEASCAFNESFGISLQGALRIADLRKAVNQVIARHEALRSTIDADGRFMHVMPALSLDIPVRDLSSLAPDARDAEYKRVLAADACQAFDLVRGPLVRAEIVRLDTTHHQLNITSHHLVCDGWSANLIVDEIATLYSAKVGGTHPEMNEPVPFSKYANAQAGISGTNASVEAYWLGRFRDLPAPLELPTDRPRPSVKTHAGATTRYHIDAEHYRKIKQMGARHGCTLFATLLAGFYVLLHRLSNQSDIVVGVPTAGQSTLDEGTLVGHCVNFLPLRTTIENGMPFDAALRQAKRVLLDAYEHQTYTYGTLVRQLGVTRDPARLPLMEVQFNLERLGTGTRFAELDMAVEPNPKASVILDLFFNVIESDTGLTIDCDYNVDLFDEATVLLWMRYYETLLLDAVSAPEKAVSDLSIMTDEQRSSLIATLNPAPIAIPPSRSIVDLFEQRAAQSPQAIAVQFADERVTYRTLNARANQLARYLQRVGVTPASMVATSFERSIDMIVAMLAVLKAGAAYVPLDSSYPLERLTMLMQDAKPKVLLTHKALADSLPKDGATLVRLDADWSNISREDASNLPALATPQSHAYVIYTSGSTGTPKGVLVSHHNVVRLLKSTEQWFGFGETDVWTLFHSSSFDFSVWEIWGCLLTGGRLVIVPYLVTRSPQEFYNLLSDERVTVLNQTPAAFYQLIQVEESGETKPLSLRYVIFGGEALNFASLRPWLGRHGDQRPQLINMYGITETTVHVTYRLLNADDIASEGRSLIGTPIPDLRLYVLDANRRPVPPGVTGEIYVGGAGVASGYLNKPDLTAERFIADPFAGTPDARMYKSGDLARVLATGDVEYLGRADSQIKIRGFRIEPGEIEAAMVEHPAIEQAVATVRRDDAGDPRLVGYFVARPGITIAPSEVRQLLQSKLPAHMVPHACVAIDFVPLTINGKVDQRRLPAPDFGQAVQSREYVPPTTPHEQALATIVCEILKLPKLGVTDNLFELGADSLHVFQITSRATKMGLPIMPKLVLQQRTIRGILAELKQDQTAAQSQTITPVERSMYRVKREVTRSRKAQD